MHKLPRVTILIIVLLISTQLSAKKKPESGYIVTLSNDTIKGMVNCYSWLKDNSEIAFSRNAGGTEIIYSPLSILSFGTENEIYRSAVIKVDKNTLAGMSTINYKTPHSYTDTVFVKVLVDGDKQLLVLNDSTGRENFFIKIDSDYIWLTHYSYAITANGKRKKINNNNYIGQLIMYLDDCHKFNEYLSKTKYNTSSLLKAFDKYYYCRNLSTSYRFDDKALNIAINAIAGGKATKLAFNNDAPHYLAEANFNWSYNFIGGIAVDIALPGDLHSWSINNEVFYSSYNTTANYSNYIDEDNYSNYNISLGANYININNMLRAHFNSYTVEYFVNLGISNGFVIANKNKLTGTTVTEGVFVDNNQNAIEKYRKYEPRLIIGGGVIYNRFCGEMRYEYGRGASSAPEKSFSNSLLFIIGYEL